MKHTTPLRKRVAPAVRLSAAAVVASLALTACGSDGDSKAQDLEGVEVGATQEEYKAAFADMEPIELIAQVAGGPDSEGNLRYRDYFDAVEEWSDGKVTFEVNFSDAIVPVTEIDDALVDGRLDISYVLPVYEPDTFKAGALLAEASVAGHAFPYGGTMNMIGASNAAFYDTPEMVAEFTDKGIYPLAAQMADGTGHFFCKEPISSAGDLKGLEATMSSQSMATQFKDMGITPVSLAFAEYFESVQRGVVDCVTTGATPAELAGITAAAPNITINKDASFASPAAVFAISQAKWDSLPLPAQQLMHDRLDTMFAGGLQGGLNSWKSALATSAEKKATVNVLPEAGVADMLKGADKVLAGVEKSDVLDGKKLVSTFKEQVAAWDGHLAELGITDPEVADFRAFVDAGEFKINEFVEKLMTEVYLDRRPS